MPERSEKSVRALPGPGTYALHNDPSVKIEVIEVGERECKFKRVNDSTIHVGDTFEIGAKYRKI